MMVWLKCYVENKYTRALISHATNTIPNVSKWLSTQNIYMKWSNLLRNAPYITYTKLTHLLIFMYGNTQVIVVKKHILKQYISPVCNLCSLQEINIYLHILLCCANQHVNNLRTNRYDIVVHALATTLMAHPHLKMFRTRQHWHNRRPHPGKHNASMAPPLHMQPPMMQMPRQTKTGHTMHFRHHTYM